MNISDKFANSAAGGPDVPNITVRLGVGAPGGKEYGFLPQNAGSWFFPDIQSLDKKSLNAGVNVFDLKDFKSEKSFRWGLVENTNKLLAEMGYNGHTDTHFDGKFNPNSLPHLQEALTYAQMEVASGGDRGLLAKADSMKALIKTAETPGFGKVFSEMQKACKDSVNKNDDLSAADKNRIYQAIDGGAEKSLTSTMKPAGM